MRIKIRYHDTKFRINNFKSGDWFDLSSAEDVTLEQGDYTLISLGVSMELPKGYEAHVVPRSSTFKNYGIIQTNHIGIIDNSYNGNDDIWKYPALAFKDCEVKKGERLCQFRVVLSQKATIWQKIKYIFDNKIDFIEVDELGNTNRDGFGSTGK